MKETRELSKNTHSRRKLITLYSGEAIKQCQIIFLDNTAIL